MSEERRQAVLQAIVEGYVSTSEPVGSQALARSKSLGVSPATIRNDMTILEEEGLITQPHTSAGRVPTDKGYRFFVDHLAARALREPHRNAIRTFLSDAVDLNDVVERSVRLLSQLTRQVAVVQYPSLRDAAIQRVELVRMSQARALAIVISADARVEQATVDIDPDATDEQVARAAAEINVEACGLRPTAATAALEAWAARPGQPAWAAPLAVAIAEAAHGGVVEKAVFAGTANLARAGRDLDSVDIGSVLDALEEQVVLLRLLHEMSTEGEVSVRIGAETGNEALARTSLVAAGYARGEGPGAVIGALGPTRMDYAATMAAVSAVSRYLSTVIESE